MSSALRRFITDRQGRVVVAQPPNGPMLAWSALAVAARTSGGSGRSVLPLMRDATLAWWAGLELVEGDSPFRRTLGGATLLGLAAMRLHRLPLRQARAGRGSALSSQH
ncbi:hypothetical protein J7I44_09480 [Frateuria sp. MAH-13]|uniref:Uncharacterized protein n=1 Tax=Frateuria flava TaxID=2821489 RepID=A0ABS4DN95_9GAMM|nr:hypothetical protein [Frateuria flava]MBP1474534.1 hypothetical protein [Frateuria flava]